MNKQRIFRIRNFYSMTGLDGSREDQKKEKHISAKLRVHILCLTSFPVRIALKLGNLLSQSPNSILEFRGRWNGYAFGKNSLKNASFSRESNPLQALNAHFWYLCNRSRRKSIIQR